MSWSLSRAPLAAIHARHQCMHTQPNCVHSKATALCPHTSSLPTCYRCARLVSKHRLSPPQRERSTRADRCSSPHRQPQRLRLTLAPHVPRETGAAAIVSTSAILSSPPLRRTVHVYTPRSQLYGEPRIALVHAFPLQTASSSPIVANKPCSHTACSATRQSCREPIVPSSDGTEATSPDGIGCSLYR